MTSARLLVDTDSEVSFVTERLCQQLQMVRHPSTVIISGIGGKQTTKKRGLITLTLCSIHSNRFATVTAHVLPALTTLLPSFDVSQTHAWVHLEKIKLADPQFLTPRPIDILIGTDNYSSIIKTNIIRGEPDEPIAQLSIFGWLVLGPVNNATNFTRVSLRVTAQQNDQEVQDLLSKFWMQEEIPSRSSDQLTPDKLECEEHFQRTHSRDPSERYIVRIPLKQSPALLGNSYMTAHHCLVRTIKWLNDNPDHWPAQPGTPEVLEETEQRPGISLLVTAPRITYHWDLIYDKQPLTHLLRITALCMLFISRVKGLPEDSRTSLLSSADMRKATTFWIKATQSAYFSQELRCLQTQESQFPKNHAFSRLTAFLDQEGIIRVGGRLENTALTYTERHPAIIPQSSQFTALIISYAHKTTLHGGTQLTLAYLRRSYWIIGGRAPVKSCILHCVVCTRQRGIRAHQLMGQLPLSRVTPTRAFTHTGVDYAGPITLKAWKGRGNKTTKGWICVFVCMTTSAVHLETATDYSTEEFIAVYRWFVSRRGIPSSMYSDCGTNFRGADHELRRLFTRSSQENLAIASALSKDATQWSFNPPAAPHMGGKWESVVKLVKFHLRRTIGETLFTYSEMATLLAQIEAILNSRPLEPLSDDPNDVSALTPGHFLIGTALSVVPEPSLNDISMNRLSRWQFIQQRIQSFWSQWSSHYLQHLQSISKRTHPSHSIQLNSIVLITDERQPPCKWPLARVVTLHPGKDELTRVVTVKTATTTLT